MKNRVIIDQGPTALYCSDECQMVDLARSSRSAVIGPSARRATPSPSHAREKDIHGRRQRSSASRAQGPPDIDGKVCCVLQFSRDATGPCIPKRQRPASPSPTTAVSSWLAASLPRSHPLLLPNPKSAAITQPRSPASRWLAGQTAATLGAPPFTALPPRAANKPFTGEVAIKAYGSFSTPARSGVSASCPTVLARLPSEAGISIRPPRRSYPASLKSSPDGQSRAHRSTTAPAHRRRLRSLRRTRCRCLRLRIAHSFPVLWKANFSFLT